MENNEKLYFEALAVVENLVDEVIERCNEVAEENHFEREWVLRRFRERFNAKVRG